MITKRIIPCLDVRDGRVVKGVNFEGLRDVNSPVALAEYYTNNGADELVFYDITASAEGRALFTDILRDTASSAGEVVVNSIDTDGVMGGFDLEMLAAVCSRVRVPVVASGGAGSIADFVTLFRSVPRVSAGLAASIFHFGEVAIPDLKRELDGNDINVRL